MATSFSSTASSISTINANYISESNAVQTTIATLSNAIATFIGTSNLNCSGSITAGGTITANGDITAFSDSRLKTDLQVIPDAVLKVNLLNGYTYLRKDQPGNMHRYAGVVAQEVQAVLPEVVNVDDKSGLLSVAYGNISALLIQSIKELSARVATLEAKLA